MNRGGKRPGAGKKKGSKHQKTIEWESFGQTVLSSGLTKALFELNKLKGEKYLYHYEKFLSYFQPRATQNISISSNPIKMFLEMSPKERGQHISKLNKEINHESGT